MAITVEDGTNVAGANSYISRADATTYHADRGNSAWADASDAQKDAAILNAAEFLDASYAWIGRIVADDQAMRWPRRKLAGACEALKDRDGRTIAEDSIPPVIVRAQAELALIALGGPLVGGSAASTQSNAGPLKRVKAGSVEVEYAEAAQSPAAPASNALPNGAAEYIDRLLFGLFSPPYRASVALGKA